MARQSQSQSSSSSSSSSRASSNRSTSSSSHDRWGSPCSWQESFWEFNRDHHLRLDPAGYRPVRYPGPERDASGNIQPRPTGYTPRDSPTPSATPQRGDEWDGPDGAVYHDGAVHQDELDGLTDEARELEEPAADGETPSAHVDAARPPWLRKTQTSRDPAITKLDIFDGPYPTSLPPDAHEAYVFPPRESSSSSSQVPHELMTTGQSTEYIAEMRTRFLMNQAQAQKDPPPP